MGVSPSRTCSHSTPKLSKHRTLIIQYQSAEYGSQFKVEYRAEPKSRVGVNMGDSRGCVLGRKDMAYFSDVKPALPT